MTEVHAIGITALIIDDHHLVREGIRTALERSEVIVIGEAASKGEAMAQIAHLNPSVIVVDLNLPDGNGLEIVTWARGISESIGIVVLTMSDDDLHLLASLQAGASAFVLKTAPVTELVRAVVQAFHSPKSFSAYGLHAALSRKRSGFGLTAREIQVLAQLPNGGTSAHIASVLFISETTVKSHLTHIYRKLGVANRTEAVVLSLKNGVI